MWSKNDELDFFNDAIKLSSIENLMVNVKGKYYAFQPKNEEAKVNTPQARNGLVGARTEKWCKDLFTQIARQNDLYAVNGVVCDEIGLTRQSAADLALCTSPDVQQSPDNIKVIFEIKMGIVNNYYFNDNADFVFFGDYKTHKGNPSLLRSDSMLKAIGKSINLRVDSTKAKRIPIIVLGNSPITTNYIKKVDCLKQSGVIQKFISLYPNPTEHDFIRDTPEKGFETYDSPEEIEKYISRILNDKMNYFSSMMSNKDLGRIISIANRETTDELKGQRFIEMLNL
ncbi:MAG: hypothetical protein J6Y82_11545 [Bacteroidales bacterium]|nr:hypothetical protein [Bacteroidales bacterium]